MNVNKDELSRRFDEYNRLYFSGKLGRCRFYFLPIDALGTYLYDSRKKESRRSTIMIAKNARWSEDTLKEVIIHEMVHMYVRTVLGIRFSGLLGHGFPFRRECRRLKKRYGLTVRAHPNLNIQNKPKPKKWEKILQVLIDW